MHFCVTRCSLNFKVEKLQKWEETQSNFCAELPIMNGNEEFSLWKITRDGKNPLWITFHVLYVTNIKDNPPSLKNLQLRWKRFLLVFINLSRSIEKPKVIYRVSNLWDNSGRKNFILIKKVTLSIIEAQVFYFVIMFLDSCKYLNCKWSTRGVWKQPNCNLFLV